MKNNRKIKKIILITEMFPYSSSEQFLETEIKYYKNYNLIILPRYNSKTSRILSSDVYIDKYLIDAPHLNTKDKIIYVFDALFSIYFLKECKTEKLYSVAKIKTFLASMLRYYYYYNLLDEYFMNKNNLEEIVIYTYWNTEITYALQTLKKKYKYKLISRIHGYDIYEYRRANNYMPLKKQFTKEIDKIFTITESANEYLHNTYNFNYSVLELSRLGVEDNNIISHPSKKGIVHIVSCSYLVEVKQIDKIIKALSLLTKLRPEINYMWTHIGDGQLYKELLNMANFLLNKIDNIQYNFIGHLENIEVYEFYKKNYVDVFINVSSSEGVPVSIMEAMSCHIPIIAPNIGGIHDMIDTGKNGILLSSKSLISEIVDALNKEVFFKNSEVRNFSYKIFLNKYNAKKNYSNFVDKITKL